MTLVKLAKTGKLAGLTIVNNIPLANLMASLGVPYVVSRTVSGSGDAQPHLSQTSADVQLGKDYWNSGICQRDHNLCDSRVYIIPWGTNEQGTVQDGYFFYGMMQAATNQGRKLAIFSNGVGSPGDYDGITLGATWTSRISSGCLAYGKSNGHLANLHQYGRMVGTQGTDDPGSAIFPNGSRDDGAYFWFGGRHQHIWELLPVECRMKIFVGECGSSNANLHSQSFISDFNGYQDRYGTDNAIAAYAYWSTGDSGGFAYSTLDPDLGSVVSLLNA